VAILIALEALHTRLFRLESLRKRARASLGCTA
jgi:hypothetical protein